MKLLLYLLPFIFTTNRTFGQNFEGKISYWVDYQNNKTHEYDTSLTIGLGNIEMFYIKNGDFLITGNGLKKEWILYKSSANKIYEKYKNNDTLYVIDASINNDTILDTWHHKTSVKITSTVNGVKKTRTEKYKECVFNLNGRMEYFYYFRGKYKVDSKLFANFKREHFGNFLAISNSLPAIRNYNIDGFNCNKNANYFTPGKLDDKLFEIPCGLIMKQ